MKVFVVTDVDGTLNKVFTSKESATSWVKERCRRWAESCGEVASPKYAEVVSNWTDIDPNGNESTVTVPMTHIYDPSCAEYHITPMELE